MASQNPFGAESTLKTKSGDWKIYQLRKLAGLGDIDTLPFSIRVLLEALLRNVDEFVVTSDDVKTLANWNASKPKEVEVPFMPGRVVLQDFTGVPAVVDLAALRAAMVRMGGDPKKINPLVPCDLVIDHSVQVDSFGTASALQENIDLEFQRNGERYRFLRWGAQAFNNFRVVPPATGIVHQVNLEYLAKGVLTKNGVAFPDSLVGTDSHTTMINGLGVVGWGVGGIEAEAVMLGQPIYMLTPEVVGFELKGSLREGVTATDLVLTVTQMLRKHGVVGKFVEFFGPGLDHMSLADRATIANMAPEYGATMGFFPVDDETLNYLRRTGRTENEVDLVERYYKEQGLFRTAASPTPRFSSTLGLDLAAVEPSMAGPKRPQDRVLLKEMQSTWRDQLGKGFGRKSAGPTVAVNDGSGASITDGAVVIAAITSCTNTSNPSVLIGAGLLARNAVAKGLIRKPWVKTSLAPGSRVVTDYLAKSGLDVPLNALGFNTVGYGCTTCIGNSGPLPDPIAEAIEQQRLVAVAVLSGNRNFEARVHPLVRANYLASPVLVVAYALAGRADLDLSTEPLGTDPSGRPVYLVDIWPSAKEISDVLATSLTAQMFSQSYARVFEGDVEWQRLEVPGGSRFAWDRGSTYVQEPPFFQDLPVTPGDFRDVVDARVLATLGDSVTTDHISPAGSIPKNGPAARFLLDKGVAPADWNTFGARRGNHEVMMRGTFGNVRIKNGLVPEKEGNWTLDFKTGEVVSIYDAAMRYLERGTPLVLLVGKEYGTGSSRDWAAKGTTLLGVKAVIAESYERIHRSNLVGMGVLPLCYEPGQTRESLGLTGRESFTITGIANGPVPGGRVDVTATAEDGTAKKFKAVVRLNSNVEVDYYRHGGILPRVLRMFS